MGGGGGATGGTWIWDPGPPPWVRGSIYKKKVFQDIGPNTHAAATMAKCLHCVRTACALRAHCVHIAHAEARILTQEYLSPVY